MQPTNSKGVPLGSRGVVVSCVQGKELKSGREAVAIFTESLEELRPDQQQDQVEQETKASISELLKSEVQDLQDRSKQDFNVRLLGISSIVYVEFTYKGDPSPSAVVDHALRKAQQEQQNKARLCARFYPVDYTCPATIEEMKRLGKTIAATHFPEDAKEGCRFSVDLDKRACDQSLERINVITAFTDAIKQPPYTANLSNPEKTVLVNVIKGSCTVGIVKDYRSLAKLNIKALTANDDHTRREVTTTDAAATN